MSATIRSILSTGFDGLIVDIECSLSNNLPNIIIVGFAGRAVGEARERIRGAFASSRLELPRKRITINLAPADIPKTDSGFDLAIALCILRAHGKILCDVDNSTGVIGELSLDGSVRAVRGIIGKLLLGRRQGLKSFFIPYNNLQQAELVPGIVLYPVQTLPELVAHLCGEQLITPLDTGSRGLTEPARRTIFTGPQLIDIVGQAQAKRALTIAAAGGHNVFFSGPPGTGKSMLAKALPSLLPPLSRDEQLEVTHLHSLASHNYEKIITERPFRTPHHSSSLVSLTGGGSNLKPGEISLAHRGVLFFDEMPEFSRFSLEALRQPLEDRIISIARAKDSAEYPANFILVATANPCPCGYYGTGQECHCQPYEVIRYQQRLSGPILDRIDLFSPVHEVAHEKLLTLSHDPCYEQEITASITASRQLQHERYKCRGKLNADMTNSELKRHAKLDTAASQLLNTAARRLQLSARSYMRTVKVARTIADLAGSGSIQEGHVGEALAYRRPKPANV